MDVLANGIRLSFDDAGAGHPVVLLTGNGLRRDMWRHFEPELRREFRAISLDFRGMGQSETGGKPGMTVTVDDHGRDLVAFLDALGIDRAALVGHAYGGYVAMQVAIEAPDRVSAIVPIDCGARIEGATREALPRWADTVERDGMASLIEPAMKRWFVERVWREHPETIDFFRQIVADNPPMGYSANCRGILHYDLREKLGAIRCPTLVVAGAQDVSVPVGQKQFLADRIPGAEIVVYEGASHTVPEELPEEFNRATLDFLRRATAAAA